MRTDVPENQPAAADDIEGLIADVLEAAGSLSFQMQRLRAAGFGSFERGPRGRTLAVVAKEIQGMLDEYDLNLEPGMPDE